jgi:hypothetical protein
MIFSRYDYEESRAPVRDAMEPPGVKEIEAVPKRKCYQDFLKIAANTSNKGRVISNPK